MSDEGYSSTGGPFFSVVIPSYNSAWSLGAALSSIQAQTWQDLEIIVVDDGSSDDTARLVAAYPVHYIYQPNAGRAAARNAGIDAAKGQWVAFLDADDLWLPRKLELQYATLRQNDNAVMIYGQAYALSDRDLLRGSLADLSTGRVLGSGRPGGSACLREFLLGQFDVRTCTVAARRDVIVELGGFDTQFRIAEDWDIFMRLAQRGPVVYIPDVLAIYWVGPFANRLDRARRYNSHVELRQVAEKNLRLAEFDQTDAAFAGQVIATYEWRCALVECGLEHLTSARAHVSAVYQASPSFLTGGAAAHILVEHLYDVLGKALLPGQLESALAATAAALIDAGRVRQVIYRKSMGYLHARRAFQAYRADQPGVGIRQAVLAARFDPTWLRNRGLWTSALRRRRADQVRPDSVIKA